MAAKLLRRYNTELISNPDVRSFMAAVSQDPQKETVAFNESITPIRNYASQIGPERTGQARRLIIGYLNDVFFTPFTDIPLQWWFEMHTRLIKVCTVSMVLEGDNLRSFGAVPGEDDIPQALIGVFTTIIEKRKQFDALRIYHLQKVHDLKVSNNDYVRCYTQFN